MKMTMETILVTDETYCVSMPAITTNEVVRKRRRQMVNHGEMEVMLKMKSDAEKKSDSKA